MLTMTRTEAIPYASMKAGHALGLGDASPSTSTPSTARPRASTCIQYMPTASLMTYVMGLEAAKTAPATDAERKEMQRLLHEGMDAGLCGFSVQRLGPNSAPEPTSTARRWSTDTMHEETCSSSPRARPSATRASSQLTAGRKGGGTTAFLEELAKVAERPILYNAIIAIPALPRHPQEAAPLARALPRAGPADLRPGLHHRRRATRSRSRTGTSTTRCRPGARPRPAPSRSGSRSSPIRRRRPGAARLEAVPLGRVRGHRRRGGPQRRHAALARLADPRHRRAAGQAPGRRAARPRAARTSSRPSSSACRRPTRCGGYREVMIDPVRAARRLRRRRARPFPHGRPLPDRDDHPRGAATADVMSLEDVHAKLSALPAYVAGFRDRGTIEVGKAADIVVYDFENLAVLPVEKLEDQPGGEWRRVQRAQGLPLRPGERRGHDRGRPRARPPSGTHAEVSA